MLDNRDKLNWNYQDTYVEKTYRTPLINGQGSSHVCLYTIFDVPVSFTTKACSQLKSVCSSAKSQQFDHKDLLFTHFIIAVITSGLKNYIFAEVAPCTF